MVDYYSCMFALVYSVKAESHYGFFHPCLASTLDAQVPWHVLRDICATRQQQQPRISRASPRRTVMCAIRALSIAPVLDIAEEPFHHFPLI